MKKIALFLIAFTLFAGNVQAYWVNKQISQYPFVASEARAAQIRGGVTKITKGMTFNQTKAVLGDADEVRAIMMTSPMTGQRLLTGYTHSFVVRRMAADGPPDQKQEAVLRVWFDTNRRVSIVDHWGL